MKAIDRVMAAYRRVHEVSEERAATVRNELSAFIDNMLAEKLPMPPKPDVKSN